MRIAHLIALPLLACLLRPIRADQIVIPLEVDSGDRQGRDNRVFTVPIEVGAVSTRFVWGCGGETIITQRVAEAARLQVKPSRELDVYTDAEGRPLFLGEAAANLHFGGRLHQITAWIMRESEYTRGMAGTIGYEVARRFQWELDPTLPTLTLRPLGTRPAATTRPLAVLPLRDEDQNLWLNVRIRNAAVDCRLIPQTSDVQAGPELQKKWDLVGGGIKPEEIKTYMGNVRVLQLSGKNGAWLGKDIYEPDVKVLLLDASATAKSGLGQSLLNRYIYCVDSQLKTFTVLRRAGPGPATQPVRP